MAALTGTAFKGQYHEIYYWDRELWSAALSYHTEKHQQKEPKFRMETAFNHIFIGHTSTMNWKTDQPMKKPLIFIIWIQARDTQED